MKIICAMLLQIHSKRNDFCKLGYGVMAVTLDFGSKSPGSSPGSPTMKEKIRTIRNLTAINFIQSGTKTFWVRIPVF